MTRKELLPLFKTCGWKSDQEFDALTVDLEPLQADDLQALLEIVTNRWLSNDPVRHRLRCQAFGRLAPSVADKRLFVTYVRALKAPDNVLRPLLTELIPTVNDVAHHDELVGLLYSPDPDLRRLVALILTRIGGRSAFEMISEMVADRGFPGRSEAMYCASFTAGHHAISVYETVLRIGQASEKEEAIRHLVEPACVSKDLPRVLEGLITAMTDPAEGVRAAAIGAYAAHASLDDYLEKVAPFLEDPSVAVARAAVAGLEHFRSPHAIDLLRHALRRGPNPVRLAALSALENIGTPEVLDPLIEALAHRQMVVRVGAGAILVRMHRSGKIDLARTVLWLLRSRDVNVRRMAVELVQTVKDPAGELWPKLTDFLYDEDWWVRERVVDALVDMAGEQLTPHFVRHLQDAEVVRRYYAVEILRRLHVPDALGALLRTANGDSDWLVRERSIQAVAALKDERSIPALVNIMIQEPDLRLVTIEALEGLGVKAAAPHVALMLTTEGMDLDERLAVLRCLRTLDDPAQAHAVRPRLKDSDPRVRELAREILWRWEGQQQATAGAAPPASLLDRLLVLMAERDGDDLILVPGRAPALKHTGRIARIVENVFSAEQIEAFLRPALSLTQVADLEARRDVDLSYEIPAKNLRFRVNVFHQEGGVSAVFRIIRDRLLHLESLGLPPVVQGLADLKNGLVLIGGPTGSGKSTTLAALIDSINTASARHIVTLEDPIEVRHRRKLSLINQRELGTHTAALTTALRSTLRQDPDVILVGEMRDHDTISFGISAAETGHLVFGTVHTVSAATTVDRLINACPPDEQSHVRAMLAGSLRAVVCQCLHRRIDRRGRCLAVEVMINTDAIANLIRTGKTHQIPSVITTSRNVGMQLMDVELMRLAEEGTISPEDAYLRATNKKSFETLFADGIESSERAAGSA